MKLTKILLAGIFALIALIATSASYAKKPKELTCCEKAKAEGKDCAHECCVKAKADGKVCEKCNPPKKGKNK